MTHKWKGKYEREEHADGCVFLTNKNLFLEVTMVSAHLELIGLNPLIRII